MWRVGRASKPGTAMIQSLDLEQFCSLSDINIWLVHCIVSPSLLKYFSCFNFWQFLNLLIQLFSLYWLQSVSDAVPTTGTALDLQFNFHWGHQSALCTGALQQRYGWTWYSSVFFLWFIWLVGCYSTLLLGCHSWCTVWPVQATLSCSALAIGRYSLIPQI